MPVALSLVQPRQAVQDIVRDIVKTIGNDKSHAALVAAVDHGIDYDAHEHHGERSVKRIDEREHGNRKRTDVVSMTMVVAPTGNDVLREMIWPMVSDPPGIGAATQHRP